MAARVISVLALAALGRAQPDVSLECLGYMTQLQSMNDVCCALEPRGDCGGTYPSTCAPACAGVIGQFLDDCDGTMTDILFETLGQDFVDFTDLCESTQQGDGVSNHVDLTLPTNLVEFDCNMRNVNIADGSGVAVCGSFNDWCQQGGEPLMLAQQTQGTVNVWRGNTMLNQGTWEYQYVIINANGDVSTWETVPERCGVIAEFGQNRVVTVVNGNHQGGITNTDRWSRCGVQNQCTADPELDVTFLGHLNDRTENHEVEVHGDAHVEADGVHFDGEADFISIPNFNYHRGARFTISMWVSSAVCDESDASPSIYGYLFSHAELSEETSILQQDNQNINIYQSCAGTQSGSGYERDFVRFVMVANRGFASWDVMLEDLDEHLDASATFTHFSVVYNTNSIEMYVNGMPLLPEHITESPIYSIPQSANDPSLGTDWVNAAISGSLAALVDSEGRPGIGNFNALSTDIYIGGRVDENEDRFYTGAIAGLEIFTDGLSATDIFCEYEHGEELIVGTTAHSCSFHSEGYQWIDPSSGYQCGIDEPFCDGTTHVADLCSPASPLYDYLECSGNFDDGYIHFGFVNYTFPFMGRAEQEMYVHTNGYISFSGDQALDGGTAPIPSAAAQPDDSIFVYWTDLDFRGCANGDPGFEDCTIAFTFDDADSLYFDTWTITWLNVPYYCGEPDEEDGPITCHDGSTASFQVTLFPDGEIKMQYQELHSDHAPNWAPVSVGLEGTTGFDGIQVSFDDQSFPRTGTAIGFSSSCGMAGENDCDEADIERAQAACTQFGESNPSCTLETILGGGPQAEACTNSFCDDLCFGEAYNLREDCVINPRAEIDLATRGQINDLIPTELIMACPEPDTGEQIPIEFLGGAYCPVLNTYIAVHGGLDAWYTEVYMLSQGLDNSLGQDELDEICHEWNQNQQDNPCYRSTTQPDDAQVFQGYAALCAGGRGAHLGPVDEGDCEDDGAGYLAAMGVDCARDVQQYGCDFDMSLIGMAPGTMSSDVCQLTCGTCTPGGGH